MSERNRNLPTSGGEPQASGRNLVTATWAMVACWSLYGVAALAVGSKPVPLAPPTDFAPGVLSVNVGRSDTPDCKLNSELATHRCSDDVWHFVGPYAGRANGTAVRCLWIHPPKDGKELTLRWDAVELATEVTANLILMPGSNGGATVRASVSIDGEPVGTATTDHERSVGTVTIKVAPSDEPRDLKVVIGSKNNRWRLACLQLYGARGGLAARTVGLAKAVTETKARRRHER